MASIAPALKVTKQLEGGYVNDPDDNGGATNFGITEKVARAHGFKEDMKDLKWEKAEEIYKTAYWDKLRLDEVTNQSVAHFLFDIAINCGLWRAIHFLQFVLLAMGAYVGNTGRDGKFGNHTLNAMNTVNQATLFTGLKNMRRSYYKFLSNQPIRNYDLDSFFTELKAAPRNSQRKFYAGWIKHRVDYFKFKS